VNFSIHLRQYLSLTLFIYLFLFIQAISVSPLQVHYYSEGLPTQHRHCRSFMLNCYRLLWVKDLPKVPTWQIERDI